MQRRGLEKILAATGKRKGAEGRYNLEHYGMLYDANHGSGLMAFCLKRNSKYNPGPFIAG